MFSQVDIDLAKANYHHNRYYSVFPFVHTIPSDEYLNASWITFSDIEEARHEERNTNKRKYNRVIAAQAPVPVSFARFFRCILKQNVKVVVMLCNVYEQQFLKADQYWPSPGTCYEVEGILIENLLEVQDENFVYRTLQISIGHLQHTFVQIHYTEWPDGSIPKYYMDCYQLLGKTNRILNNTEPKNVLSPSWLVEPVKDLELANPNTTMLIHCSAGIGRTGTFIAMHYGIFLLKNNKTVDIIKIIMEMRESRPYMVQNLEQAAFIIYFLENFKHVAKITVPHIELKSYPTNLFED